MSRYPYTYACDYLREAVGGDCGEGLMSRGAASRILSTIAEALCLDDETVAKALADEFKKKWGITG